MTESRILSDIDFEKDGRQSSFLRAPSSTNASAYGTVLIPITVIKHGAGPTMLITGGVHGDEYEAPITLSKLARRLDPAQIRGRIILVPALNLPAVMAGTRLSPLDGHNLNRVFPGDANGSLTSMIAHYVGSVLIPMADIVVDLHSGGRTLEYIPAIIMHERDDAEWTRRTRAAMLAFGAPIALVSRELDNAVYLDTIAENLGKITISAELGGAGTLSRQSLNITEAGVLNLLGHFSMIEDKASAPETQKRRATRLMHTPDADCYTIAGEDGIFEPFFDLGENVAAGQELGHIHFLQHPDRAPVPVVCKRSGILICRRPPAQVSTGDCLGIVALDYPS
jgi:ectoine utilization protein EutE